ncbi:MAG: ferredoxin--NADP reductase [Bacteroidales bacterium]
MNMNVQVDKSIFVTEQVRILTPSTYVVRFSRNEMKFNPGQHLILGLPGSDALREYSIYSGADDPFLEVLIKEVDEGMVSKTLKNIAEGDRLEVKGPYGFFLGNAPAATGRPLLFIASGTGIAPFHSYVRSYPRSDYRIIHGVRNMEEAYEMFNFSRDRLHLCTSRDPDGDFEGRLTEYLKETELNAGELVYLCGNSHMIYDAMDILHDKGVPQRNIFTEVYF